MSEFRRVHRLTPLLKFWQFILAAIAMVALNFNQETLLGLLRMLGEFSSVSGWLLGFITIAVFAILCGLIWAVSGVWWRACGYRLSPEELALTSGVVSTKLRTARYDRIQAVDVVENVISRVFGVAAVRVETAGGNDSVVDIAFLSRAKAQDLRAEILRRCPGGLTSPSHPGSPTGDSRPEIIIPPIPISRSLIVAALSSFWFVSTAGVFLWFGRFEALVPMLVGALPAVWKVLDRSWNFTAVLADDVLDVSFGLADRRKQSIPLQRIHGVRIRQPMLWRLFDWWMVDVSIAGYATKDKRSGTTRLLPVGTREQAMHLTSIIAPLTRAELETYAAPEGCSQHHSNQQDPAIAVFRSPRRACWVSPIDFVHQATTLLADAVIVHSGRFSRRVAMIHPSHIQELTLRRGPVQHLAHLDTVRLDLVDGPVRMSARDLIPGDAQELLASLRPRKLPDATP